MRGSSTLWRALETARRRNLAEAGEAPPVPGGEGMSRRAMLQALAAAGVVAALPRPARAARPGKVAIIGGGIAGLTALHYLTEAGIDAHLYEGRERTGGRMYTHVPATGPAFEVGGQLVNTDHLDMHALISRFGIKLIDRKAEPHDTLILADGRLVEDAELANALRGIAGQIGKDADRLDKDYAGVSRELDRISFKDYLDKHAALISEPWVRRLLEMSCRTEFGVEPEESSGIQLIFNLPTVHGQRAEVLGGSDEKFVMEGGSGALAQAMTANYASRISTGKRLLGIRPGLRLAFLDGTTAHADTVIVAVPAPIMRQIDFRVPLPRVWRAFIDEITMGRNEKVQALAAEAVWREPMGRGGELWQTDEKGYALGWDGSVHLPGQAVDPVWTWYLGGKQTDDIATSPEAQAHGFALATDPAIPGLSGATRQGPCRRTGWHRDPFTMGAYSCWAPGQLTRFGHLLSVESEDPAEHRVARADNVIFAGEHVSDAFPGFMNGGAQTGRMAAEAILGKALLAKAA
ncbi:FAD-dependent oxidoreductase [Sphingomonas sp. LB-2]|uniref:flavin monoamine oxidase family protein n=1 Tax=Sphingomonas caeni TaxID=2984949 RepID=UPI00222FAF37|nr:NAD(P)/FAD-dependent oxidoreductase [Sphingomonas caeni]MCW3846878.1 FAD-dependent oxidoreductase [Sphingomonas caeni]